MNVNIEKTDILSRQELKKMPFDVPEGYFSDFHKEALKQSLKTLILSCFANIKGKTPPMVNATRIFVA